MSHTAKKYLLGFILCIILTLLAYDTVRSEIISGNAAIFTILGLAVVQALVQLTFFLHLGEEPKPKWNLVIFISTAMLILIIISASLWIMNSLNYRHMSGSDQENYLLHTEGIHK